MNFFFNVDREIISIAITTTSRILTGMNICVLLRVYHYTSNLKIISSCQDSQGGQPWWTNCLSLFLSYRDHTAPYLDHIMRPLLHTPGTNVKDANRELQIFNDFFFQSTMTGECFLYTMDIKSF